MLDVILYGHDRSGRFVAEERACHSLRSLSHFFGTGESISWEWAEVIHADPDGQPHSSVYGAEDFRMPSVPPGSEPSEN